MDDNDVHLTRGQPVHPPERERARGLRRDPTTAESALWDALRNRQLQGLKFRRQQPIAHYFVDFYCAEAHLVVEVDGPPHDSQQGYDEERTRVLEAHGLTVLRFPNHLVLQSLSDVLATIAAHCPRASGSRVGDRVGG